MGETNISGIGKILSVRDAGVTGFGNSDEDVKVSFSAMMSQTSLKNADGLAQDAKSQMNGSVQQKDVTQTSSEPSVDYEKFQYKDKDIQRRDDTTVPEDTELITEKMDAFSESVKEVLKEELGVTDEEIEAAMETLGLSFTDLLNQNNLANLVRELSGGENINTLLCNEQFVTVLKEVNALGQELLQTLGMNVEDLQKVMETLNLEQTAEAVALEDENLQEFVIPESEKDLTEETKAVTGQSEKVTAEVAQVESLKETDVSEAKDNLPITEGKSEAEGKAEAITVADGAKEEQSSEEGLAEDSKESEFTGNSTESATKNDTVKTVNPAGEHAPEAVSVSQNNVIDQIAEAKPVENLPEFVSVRDIINQIVEAVKITAGSDTAKLEMQLNPENLGKMYLEITEKEGAVSAKIQIQNAAVKEAVEAQMAELKQNLNQAGVKVDAVEVTVASHEFEQNLEQDAEGEKQQAEEQEKALKQRRINLNDLDELSGLMSEEEALVAKMMAEQGNSVDFTA